eukprot:TRINITY_DN35100_c0_g1_i1.p1 TRINITY_DN35100_c0_g1~~TRINITY_DN35100_c0_g1_i1.p1  ORF type:complete len:884 (+),score=135.69 TRINITY_DN35100_c0_g1_i1:43-2694(+)
MRFAQWLLGAGDSKGYALLPTAAEQYTENGVQDDKLGRNGSKGGTKSGMNGRKGSKHSDYERQDCDIVQFLSRMFYAEESSKASMKIIRIGKCQGTCSVRCKTRDGSAKAHKKYFPKDEVIEFQDGEYMKAFELDLVDDDNFDTTLDLDICLSEAQNCSIPSGGVTSKLLIIDNDLFPSSRFQKEIELGSDALHKVGARLLMSFMWFTWRHVPTIWWKSIVMIVLAQLGNIYYLMTIELKVYLVDVCLNMSDESTMDRLIVPGSRKLTAAALGVLWILPNFLLLAAGYFEMSVLEMGYHIRQHLRVNLFRKYLNYTSESRAEVPIQDLKSSMMDDIPALVKNGYLLVFELIKKVGKVLCVALFLLHRHPRAAVPLVIYPLLIVSFLGVRHKRRVWLLSQAQGGESRTQGWLIHADSAFELVQDYQSRGKIVQAFMNVLSNQRQLGASFKRFSFWNGMLIPWITIVATGCYIALAGHLVCDNMLSLGSFLATINLYKDLGDRFEGIYADFESLSEVIQPLAELTIQFNLETDLKERLTTHNLCEDFATANGQQGILFDSMPTRIDRAALQTGPEGSQGAILDLTVPQGSLVHVKGPHGSGKSSFLSCMAFRKMPAAGAFLRSPHLWVVNVGSTPMFVKGLSLAENLFFGLPEQRSADHPLCRRDRIQRIFSRLGLEKTWLYDELLKDISSPSELHHAIDMQSEEEEAVEELEMPEAEAEDETVKLLKPEDMNADSVSVAHSWESRASYSERKRLHLIRAFICNPEVLVLHRPVDDMDDELAATVLDMLKEFVDERGLEMDPATKHRRRPRTVFFSGKDGPKYSSVDTTIDLATSSSWNSYLTNGLLHRTTGNAGTGNGNWPSLEKSLFPSFLRCSQQIPNSVRS